MWLAFIAYLTYLFMVAKNNPQSVEEEEAKVKPVWQLLILAVVAVIVVIIVKKDRNTSEQEAPIPVPFTDGEAPQTTIIGPRSALRHAAPPSQREDATVKFQKVDESSSLKTNGEATTKFRRITDDEND